MVTMPVSDVVYRWMWSKITLDSTIMALVSGVDEGYFRQDTDLAAKPGIMLTVTNSLPPSYAMRSGMNPEESTQVRMRTRVAAKTENRADLRPVTTRLLYLFTGAINQATVDGDIYSCRKLDETPGQEINNGDDVTLYLDINWLVDARSAGV